MREPDQAGEWRSPLILQAAQRDRDRMVLEGAHATDIRAADVSLQAYRDGLPIPEWAIMRLRQYAEGRQQQNRWGK